MDSYRLLGHAIALAAAIQPGIASTVLAQTTEHTVEQVLVPSGRIVLVSTLLTPGDGGPHPAIVLISGSQDVVFSHDDSLPRRLVSDGLAVLVLGKRGVHGSTGNWRRESFEQRAEDVRRAIDFMENRSDVDRERIGLVGHSQGGWIAQIVAAEDSRIGFVVLLAGSGETVRNQILTDERIQRERRGLSPDDVERDMKRLRLQLGVLSVTGPVCRALRAHYLCHVLRFDPTPYLERIRVPVLAVFGELDPMVPPDPNLRLVADALARAGNKDVTTHIFPRANHIFFEATTGLVDEYPRLERRYVDGFLDMVSCWIGERVAVRSNYSEHPLHSDVFFLDDVWTAPHSAPRP